MKRENTDENTIDISCEKLYLMNIESQIKMCMSEIENFCETIRKRDITIDDLSQKINSLDTYYDYFLSYEPIAKRLSDIGRKDLSEKTNEILSDVKETSTILRQLYKYMKENNNGI